MNLKRLKHVLALADERNFARAAAQVHLSQPAFSRSIQALEEELGMRLFERGNTEVSATAAGVFLIQRARKLLFDSRCLERDIDLYRKNLIGNLAFGVGPFPAVSMLPELMPALRQAYPGIKLRVEVNNWNYLLEHLRNEELDFFVADTRDLPPSADLKISLLARQFGGFFVRAGHPLLKQSALSLSDILPFGIASVCLPQAIRLAIAQLLKLPADAELPIALECDDVMTLKRTAIGSDTVLALIHAAVIDELANGSLIPLPLSGIPLLHSEMGVVSLQGRSHSPVALFLIEKLQALASQLAELHPEQLTRITSLPPLK
ncbi:LysR family transcriptional regulator [Undibacterium sp.]|uniref:LysR family transcriptional regulator n=1 Tax=Undibacterium sp. TaxID=1914977 RepID=UPI0025FC85D7|nr:LysR family transcriptional regulator [Undibacterium sp.]